MQKIICTQPLAKPTTELYSLLRKKRKRTTKTEIENKIDNESPLKSQRGSTLNSRQASCISSWPRPSLVRQACSPKSPPASSPGQDPSLSAALGNTSLKSLNFRISQEMCLLEVVAPKRRKLFSPVPQQRSCNGNPVIRTQQVPFSPQNPGTKCFSSNGWLKFWFSFYAGWSLRSQVSCLDSHSMEREREGSQSFEVFFLIPFSRVSCRYSTVDTFQQSKLLSAFLYRSKTMFLFIYLDTLGLPELTESLQRFHSPPHNN